MEVYFGPPKLMASYIRTHCLSTPVEMKALRAARDELGQAKMALISETAKLTAAERRLQHSDSNLHTARAMVSDLEGALHERNDDLAEMTAARNRWRKAALALGAICALLGWWLSAGR
ncbi:hypothetical protein MTBSS4_90137 [Magnetospirillum sp. SS-4]|nr:hypothetical protein MTBSS4_90137 [Magnetospirillum sp. SS-4]